MSVCGVGGGGYVLCINVCVHLCFYMYANRVYVTVYCVRAARFNDCTLMCFV